MQTDVAAPQPAATTLVLGSQCASATLPPNLGLAGCPFYQVSEISADIARQILFPRGLVSAGLQAHVGPLVLHTFQLNESFCVSFCPYFFLLRKMDTGEALHVQLLDGNTTVTAAGEPEPMDASAAPTPQSVLRSGTP